MGKLGEIFRFKNGKSVEYDESGRYVAHGSNGPIGRTEKSNASAGTSVIGRVGEYCGSTSYLKKEGWVSDNAIIAQTKQGNSDRYGYYLLKHLPLRGFSGGSAQPLLNQRTLRDIDVGNIPPLPVQRRIADILGTLDDKIELNRRMNETMEEMAQRLYRHWFVDFGPFQNCEFKDTEEFGLIPEGWEVKPFLDTCDIETGGTPKTSIDEYWGGDILWASAKDVSQSTDTVLINTERTISPAGTENSPAEVLPAGTTAIVARGATTGRHAILGHDMALNQSCYGLVGKDGYSWGWTYLTVNALVKRLRKRAYGSAFDSVTISTFENLDIVGAPPGVVAAFNEGVMPLFEKMMVNVKENQTLAEIRDYLLPKLISVEIEVGTEEEVVETETQQAV